MRAYRQHSATSPSPDRDAACQHTSLHDGIERRRLLRSESTTCRSGMSMSPCGQGCPDQDGRPAGKRVALLHISEARETAADLPGASCNGLRSRVPCARSRCPMAPRVRPEVGDLRTQGNKIATLFSIRPGRELNRTPARQSSSGARRCGTQRWRSRSSAARRRRRTARSGRSVRVGR